MVWSLPSSGFSPRSHLSMWQSGHCRQSPTGSSWSSRQDCSTSSLYLLGEWLDVSYLDACLLVAELKSRQVIRMLFAWHLLYPLDRTLRLLFISSHKYAWLLFESSYYSRAAFIKLSGIGKIFVNIWALRKCTCSQRSVVPPVVPVEFP